MSFVRPQQPLRKKANADSPTVPKSTDAEEIIPRVLFRKRIKGCLGFRVLRRPARMQVLFASTGSAGDCANCPRFLRDGTDGGFEELGANVEQ